MKIIVPPEKLKAVAIAIRRQKFERNGRLNVFDPDMIVQDELDEAEAAIKAAEDWDADFFGDPDWDDPLERY